MMEEASTPLKGDVGAPKKQTRFSTWFSIVFVLGFGASLLAMTGIQWDKPCDQPMKVYMLLGGIAGVVASLFFLSCEYAYMESTDPGDDGSLKGTKAQFFAALVLYFLVSGIAGSAWYFSSESCEDTAFTTYRWTWAAILLFLIMASMMFSDVFGKLGSPFFAKIAHLLGMLFQAIADALNTVGDVLSEGPADAENVAPKRSAAGVFAIYVIHSALLWFFLYIFFEAWKERVLPCDKPLRRYLYVFSIAGTLITYCHFLFELFAGVKTREKIDAKKHIFTSIIVLLTVIWGALGFSWVHSSDTCKEDGNAVNTYRLSYLLSLVFLIFCGLLGVFGCMGALDFLCSGRMRFVVVISADEEEDEDLH